MRGRTRIAILALILLAVTAAGCISAADDSSLDTCDMCRRQIVPATAYQIRLADGTLEKACCPRCGLRFEEDHPGEVVEREVADFATGDRIPAEEAIYVEGSRVHLCCKQQVERDQSGRQYQLDWDRCMPSLVGFRSREDAQAFQSKEGGSLRTFAELRATL